jgi:hypothetical protein
VEQQLRLGKKVGNDGTVRDALVDREKFFGKHEDSLDQHIPPCCQALWQAFICMHLQRDPGFSGLAPLSIVEVQSYARMYGIEFSPWELDALWAIDRKTREVLSPTKEQ